MQHCTVHFLNILPVHTCVYRQSIRPKIIKTLDKDKQKRLEPLKMYRFTVVVCPTILYWVRLGIPSWEKS